MICANGAFTLGIRKKFFAKVPHFIAHNLQPSRLKRAVALEEPILEIVDRPLPIGRFKAKRDNRPSHTDLRHDDSFRLKFKAFNATFYLHLMPNRDILHQDAFFTVDNDDTTKKALRREDYRIYKGAVLPFNLSDRQLGLADIGVANYLWEDEALSLGWARVVVRNDIE